MTVLSIETATAVCSVAVFSGGTPLWEQSQETPHLHAERLLGMIDETLARAGRRARELDGIAVSIGPGSFTGLRIGLSVAKGLVFGLGKDLAAVPTLEALAWRLAGAAADDRSPYILAALDARREEVYCQLFRRRADGLQAAGPPQDLSATAAAALVEGKQAVVTGDGSEKVRRVAGAGIHLAGAAVRGCSAATVGLLGERLLMAGQRSDPATLEPWYIKEFFLRTPSS